MTEPNNVRTLHFRYPSAQSGETENCGIRIQSNDIQTVRGLLNTLSVAEGAVDSCSVELRYMNPGTESFRKDPFTILNASIQQVVNTMLGLNVPGGIAPESLPHGNGKGNNKQP